MDPLTRVIGAAILASAAVFATLFVAGCGEEPATTSLGDAEGCPVVFEVEQRADGTPCLGGGSDATTCCTDYGAEAVGFNDGRVICLAVF